MFGLGLGLSLYIGHVGRAAALASARAGAGAITDMLDAQLHDTGAAFNCTFTQDQAATAHEVATAAVIDRLEQLAAVTPTAVVVDIDPACALVVGVTVASSSWLPVPEATAVVCHYGAKTSAAVAVEALITC